MKAAVTYLGNCPKIHPGVTADLREGLFLLAAWNSEISNINVFSRTVDTARAG
jgi:hypothetical protein